MAEKIFLFLASQSLRRRQILTRMGISFQVIPSVYREKKIKNCAPEVLVLKHALGKAMGAVLNPKVEYVLAADTVVSYRHHVLGKPKNLKEAKSMLKLLSGKKHEVVTGMVIRAVQTGKVLQDYDVTEVQFKNLTDKQIDDYLKTIQPLDKAGSYAIQEGPKIVQKIKGSYSNVVGLPEELLRKMLKAAENKA